LNFIPSARDPDCPPKFFLTYLGCTIRIKIENEGTSDCTRDPSAQGLKTKTWLLLEFYGVYLRF